MPLELRLLTSRTAEDEEREREFELQQRLQMQERMRKQAEIDRLLMQATGNNTDSEDPSSDEDTTDYRQEIERFKHKQELLKKRTH